MKNGLFGGITQQVCRKGYPPMRRFGCAATDPLTERLKRSRRPCGPKPVYQNGEAIYGEFTGTAGVFAWRQLQAIRTSA